jgi:hypothetical protein
MTSSIALASQPVQGWTQSECSQARIEQATITTFTSLIHDYEKRKIDFKTDVSTLDRGVWYANDMYHALVAAKLPARLEHFKNRGSFFHGCRQRALCI